MNFEWSTNDIAKKTVTIYSTNLTLNKAACRHFEDVNYVFQQRADQPDKDPGGKSAAAADALHAAAEKAAGGKAARHRAAGPGARAAIAL